MIPPQIEKPDLKAVIIVIIVSMVSGVIAGTVFGITIATKIVL